MARGKAKGSGKTANDKEEDKDIDWVYCEACSKWMHCPKDLPFEKACEPDFIFHCKICKPTKIKVRQPLSIQFKLLTKSTK